jgi:RNA polymerase sigma-70 factor (ECF subfamily)
VAKPLFLEEMLEVLQALTATAPIPARLPTPGTVKASPAERFAVTQLHERLVTGDDSVLDELAAELLAQLLPRLRRGFPHAPQDVVVEAVEDAILEYVAQPAQFDPLRGLSIGQFLTMVARRNLMNALAKEAARKVREARYASVQPTRMVPADTDPVPDARVRARLLAATADNAERRALVAWLEGDRSTVGLAKSLGLSHLPSIEQRREVKRFKDRVVKRVVRQGRRRVTDQ